LILGIGVVSFFVGLAAINPRPDWQGITHPVEWGTVIVSWVITALVIAFYVWAGVTTRRAHPGMTLKEIAAAEDLTAAKRDGYIEIKPVQHSCSPPMFTGPRAKFSVGLGSVWECPACQQRWRLQSHEVAIGMRGKSGSTWTFVPKVK